MGLPENGEGLRGRHVALDHEEGRDDGRRARVAEQAVDEDLRERDKVTADKTEVRRNEKQGPDPTGQQLIIFFFIEIGYRSLG